MQVKLVNISNNDIVDGNAKLTLGLVWSIILHWQVSNGKVSIVFTYFFSNEIIEPNRYKTFWKEAWLNCTSRV